MPNVQSVRVLNWLRKFNVTPSPFPYEKRLGRGLIIVSVFKKMEHESILIQNFSNLPFLRLDLKQCFSLAQGLYIVRKYQNKKGT